MCPFHNIIHDLRRYVLVRRCDTGLAKDVFQAINGLRFAHRYVLLTDFVRQFDTDEIQLTISFAIHTLDGREFISRYQYRMRLDLYSIIVFFGGG